jgi:hypothetical protein
MVNPAKNRQRGKATERALAKKLGGRRIGILGRADIELEHPLFSFSIESKSRARFVAEKWFMQAIRNCEKGKIPAVVVHVSGKRYENDYVILRLKDFEDLLGVIKND